MVPVDRPGMDLHLLRTRNLPQQFPAALANVTSQYRMTILRHPNQMIFAVPHRMTAALVTLHPRMLRILSPKGEGFTDPLSGTLNTALSEQAEFCERCFSTQAVLVTRRTRYTDRTDQHAVFRGHEGFRREAALWVVIGS